MRKIERQASGAPVVAVIGQMVLDYGAAKKRVKDSQAKLVNIKANLGKVADILAHSATTIDGYYGVKATPIPTQEELMALVSEFQSEIKLRDELSEKLTVLGVIGLDDRINWS